MKALIVATAVYSLEGGLERFNRRLVRCFDELRERGAIEEVGVMGLWDTARSAAEAPRGVDFFAGHSARPRFVAAFVSRLLRQRPDIIVYAHVNFAPLIALGHLVAPRARHLLTVHGVEVWDRPPAVKGFIVRRFVDIVMAVSRFTARTMGAAYAMGDARFRVLANALDVSADDGPAAPGPREAEGDWRLLVVTRLSLIDTYKNVDKVILALPAIRARFPGTHCDIVGDGPWRGRLEEIAREAGVSSFVRFHGAVDEDLKESLYASSDVFVLPSTGEGFGIVFLEAWRHRLPVVTSREGAAPEVVRDGIDGRCVGTRPEEIAAAIVDLLADPGRRRAMGEQGYRRLRESFTHEAFRERVREILVEAGACAA